ncbi:MAG: DUF4279 domain-containing protein [Bacillota bacterium]
MNEKLIIKGAIEEITNPTFAITKQLLSVHNVPFGNGISVITRVDYDTKDGSAVVYFPFEEESYFLAVYVDTYPEVSVRWIGTEPGNRVYHVVISKELNLDELLSLAGITPTETWKIGDKINKIRVHEDNGFIFEPNPERADNLEDKIEKLLTHLEGVTEKIIYLPEKAEMQINIAYYGYKEQMWGWHLDKQTLKRLAQFNLEVDLDLYAGGPNLPD